MLGVIHQDKIWSEWKPRSYLFLFCFDGILFWQAWT